MADCFNNVARATRARRHSRKRDACTGVALPADYTFISSNHGVHTLVDGVTLATPGDQVIAATDTLSGSITGIRQPIAVRRPDFPLMAGSFFAPDVDGQTKPIVRRERLGTLGKGGEICIRILPSLYVRQAGTSAASHGWSRQPGIGSSVVA